MKPVYGILANQANQFSPQDAREDFEHLRKVCPPAGLARTRSAFRLGNLLSWRFACLSVYLFCILILTGSSLLAEGRPPDIKGTRGLAVLLLLDRSPSAALPQQQESLIDSAASGVLDEVLALARENHVPLYFGAANFGRYIGDRHDLSPLKLKAPLSLPRQEVIHFSDFRAPLDYALQQIDLSRRLYQSPKVLVILVTDAAPWPQGDDELSEEEKTSYFQGTDRFSTSTEPSLPKALQDIENQGGEILIIAVQDSPGDAKLWRSLDLRNYISTRETSSPAKAARPLLEKIVQEAKQRPEASSTANETSTLAATDQTLCRIAPVAMVVLAILAALGISAATMRQSAIGKLRIEIVNLQNRRDEELVAVENLEKKAHEAAKSNREDAIAIYQAVLYKQVDIFRKNDRERNESVSRTVKSMLDLCGRDLIREQQLLQYILSTGQKDLANGLAPVLLQRWSSNKKILLQEFHMLRLEPLGINVLDALRGLSNEHADDAQKAIATLAQAARELHPGIV